MPERLVDLLEASEITDVVCVPCSEFAGLLRIALDRKKLRVILPQREDEAIAILTGLLLASRRPIGVFQDAALGNSQNILSVFHAYLSEPLKLWLGSRSGNALRTNPVHRFITDRISSLLPPTCKTFLQVPHEPGKEIAPETLAVIGRFLKDTRAGIHVLSFLTTAPKR